MSPEGTSRTERSTGKQLWVGETGLLTVLVLVVATVIYSRGRWTSLREPPKREPAPVQQEGATFQPTVR